MYLENGTVYSNSVQNMYLNVHQVPEKCPLCIKKIFHVCAKNVHCTKKIDMSYTRKPIVTDKETKQSKKTEENGKPKKEPKENQCITTKGKKP